MQLSGFISKSFPPLTFFNACGIQTSFPDESRDVFQQKNNAVQNYSLFIITKPSIYVNYLNAISQKIFTKARKFARTKFSSASKQLLCS